MNIVHFLVSIRQELFTTTLKVKKTERRTLSQEFQSFHLNFVSCKFEDETNVELSFLSFELLM